MSNESCVIGATLKTEIVNLKEDVRDVNNKIDCLRKEQAEARKSISRILGGISIACVLLAINMLMEWVSRKGGLIP